MAVDIGVSGSSLRKAEGFTMKIDARRARNHMIEVQIAGRGIRDQRVLRAMRGVPREVFVDAGLEQFAYEDGPLPIAERQTISQPYVVALMTEAAEIAENDPFLRSARVRAMPQLLQRKSPNRSARSSGTDRWSRRRANASESSATGT
jgi:hypothetical protein